MSKYSNSKSRGNQAKQLNYQKLLGFQGAPAISGKTAWAGRQLNKLSVETRRT